MRPISPLNSKYSKQVFIGLFVRTTVVFVALAVLGGAGSLLSTLSRSPFSVDAHGVVGIFFGSLPRLSVQVLPLSALVALGWWAGGLIRSRTWLALRTVGQGGHALLAPVGAFALTVAMTTGVVAVFWVAPGDALRARSLWEGAIPRANLALQFDDLMLLPRTVDEGVLRDVSFAWGDPAVLGQADAVHLDKITARVRLEKGVFNHQGLGAILSFSTLEIPLVNPVVSRVYSGKKGQAEAMKRWVWPLMVLGLLLASLPFLLQQRQGAVVGLWFLTWGLIRFGDHQVLYWGPVFCVFLPLFFGLGAVLWSWAKWADA
jgi:lipopolysaccharide export LptBFGC system permease protein LptF